jgi:hypothetical protein
MLLLRTESIYHILYARCLLVGKSDRALNPSHRS